MAGRSAKTLDDQPLSESGAQLELWRLRSRYLYYRKHHPQSALLAWKLEAAWHGLRYLKKPFFQRARGPGEGRGLTRAAAA